MTAVQYNHMITHGRSDHDYITKRKMFDLSEPIVVSFDQRENNVKRCFVTKDETSKFVQKPLDKIIASLKQKALDGDITSKLNGLVSTFAQHQQKQSSDEDCKPVSAIPTIDLTQTGVASHPHDTVLGKTDLGTEADARQPSDRATALEAQRPSDNTNKGPRAEKRPRVVTVLSPKAGGESPPSRTTLTPKEFAQLLKTCNVTVKSVLRGGSRTEAAVKRVAKQLPRNGALVLRSPWSRGKGSTPLKWHHTNFEPAKGQQKKQQKRPSPPPSQPPCKTVSVTVRKPQVRKSSTQTRPTTVTASTTATVAITPNTSAADADADAKLPESTVDHATALSSHALPLTQALSDLASRDLASAETIRETLDCCGGGGGTSDAILPPDSDPFLSDCDLKEAGDIPGDSMAADVSRVRTLPCESDDELIESRDPILSASSNAFTCASRGGCDLKAGSKRSSSVLASFSDRDESWKRFVCDDFLESKNVCKDSKDQPNKDTKQDISNTEEMTQQLDWEQSFFPGSKSSIFDLETNLIFEDLFNVDGGKLLGDEDVTEVLNNSLSFFDMVNDMGSSNCDITPRPQSFDRRHEINNCSPNSDLSQIKYCYQGHTTNTHHQVPYDSMTSHSSTMTLRHDSMTSSCEQQFSNVQTFSDTDSGIHSPGSTPVKSSPPSGTHFGLDDVTGVKREWRSYSCHSDAMSVGDRSATPHSDQEIFYHAAGSPSAFYTNASRVLQEVFTPPSDADTPSPEPAHNLLDLAEPVRAYSVSDRFSTLQFKQQAAVDATIADVIGSSDDVALPVIKSENDYFASVTCERAESPLQNNAHLMVDCPPQPEQQQQQQQQQQQIPSKPKYRHAVGNWQIAVSLKAPNCDDASTAAELEANSRQFAPRLSVLRQDDSSNPYRRRKPRSSHNAKRKQASVVTGNLMTEGQLCCKVRKMTAEKGKAVHLWEFIRNILLDPQHCPTLIKWEDRQQGVFRFMQSDVVASMWGEKKRNPKMTYEKLSRAMRYYYNRGILERVDGRRLVYKFGPNAHGWKAPAVSSDTTGVQLASGASGDQSADDTSTTVHHLCESTGLTIPITKSPLLVPLKIEPAPNPDVLAATVDEETSVVLPQNDSEILQVTSAQDIKPIVSPTSKSPVSSWIIASPTTTVCPLALPSANVLLGKQIKLAVSH